ncbi:MAG: L-threonylcarbamoyladenylate synthase [Myxococcota bacterium]
MMHVLQPDPDGIAVAARHLRDGGVVGIPTETVYGLAAITFDPAAVARVFATKDRPSFDPLIVHVAGDDPARAVGPVVAFGTDARRRTADRLWSAFWPGPLTLVLPKTADVPDLVTAGGPSVAVRMPAHPVARALIEAAGQPLVAPSANRFGRISPTSAADVVAELGDRVAYVVDGGVCAIGVESTVVAIEADGGVALLRPGGVSVEALEAVIGPLRSDLGSPRSPGHTASHYAPRTPVTLVDEGTEPDRSLPGPIALLCRRAPRGPTVARWIAAGQPVVAAEALSTDGDAVEAARRLFAALRHLDASGARTLVVERWPDHRGLGFAIADRLARAAARG